MGTVTTKLMTVSEFLELPERMDVRRELHEGEVFELTKPAFKHIRIQRRLMDLLSPVADRFGFLTLEFPFRAEPEHHLWTADVGFIQQRRVASVPLEGFLPGSPDLVIEVESPSNSAREFAQRQRVCLSTGTQEFWIVYPDDKEVHVTTADGRFRSYGPVDTLETPLLLGLKLAVADIFNAE